MEIVKLIISILTALTAVIALVISISQIKESNRQALFDRRLKAYLKIRWMFENVNYFEKEYVVLQDNDFTNEQLLNVYEKMTLISPLSSIRDYLQNVIDKKYIELFRTKIEELKELCEEICLIFKDEEAHVLADFVFYYGETLLWICNYELDYRIYIRNGSNDDKYINRINNGKYMVSNNINHLIETAKTITKENAFDSIRKRIKL